jgi:hypothetical protein
MFCQIGQPPSVPARASTTVRKCPGFVRWAIKKIGHLDIVHARHPRVDD